MTYCYQNTGMQFGSDLLIKKFLKGSIFFNNQYKLGFRGYHSIMKLRNLKTHCCHDIYLLHWEVTCNINSKWNSIWFYQGCSEGSKYSPKTIYYCQFTIFTLKTSLNENANTANFWDKNYGIHLSICHLRPTTTTRKGVSMAQQWTEQLQIASDVFCLLLSVHGESVNIILWLFPKLEWYNGVCALHEKWRVCFYCDNNLTQVSR